MRALLAGACLCSSLCALAAPLTTPFPEDQRALPKGFEGHNCEQLAAAIERAIPARGEFEPIEAFQARLAAVESVKIGPQLTAGDVLAFTVRPADVSMEYDADDREATFSIAPNRLELAFGSNKDLLPMVIASERIVKRKRYTGSNAFGASAEVSQTHSKGCGVAMAGEQPGRAAYFTRAHAKIEPQTARSLKGAVGALLVGKPAFPFAGTFTKYHGPTLEFPLESSVDGKAIVLDLSVWYYSLRTGEILARTSR